MFVELMPLLASRTVLITVAKVDDKTLRVNVIPTQAKADEDPALTTPLTFTARPRNSMPNSANIWPATSKPTSKPPATDGVSRARACAGCSLSSPLPAPHSAQIPSSPGSRL